MNRPEHLPKPTSRGGMDPWMSSAFRTGYEFATGLANEPRHVREAIAREFDDLARSMPVDSPHHDALMGALSYLTHRHESNA